MKLIIVRHSDAQEAGEAGITSDEARTLSHEGRRKAEEVARGLKAIGCEPGAIGASPLPRALETAEIIARVVAPGATVDRCDFLKPGARATALMPWLREQSADTVMIVGHMPDTAKVASELVAGDREAGILFKKCGCCCVGFDETPAPGAGTLEWLMQPSHLRRLA